MARIFQHSILTSLGKQGDPTSILRTRRVAYRCVRSIHFSKVDKYRIPSYCNNYSYIRNRRFNVAVAQFIEVRTYYAIMGSFSDNASSAFHFRNSNTQKMQKRCRNTVFCIPLYVLVNFISSFSGLCQWYTTRTFILPLLLHHPT